MNKYTVHYIKHTRYTVEIEADSLEDAIDIAEDGTCDDSLVEVDNSTSWEVDVPITVIEN